MKARAVLRKQTLHSIVITILFSLFLLQGNSLHAQFIELGLTGKTTKRIPTVVGGGSIPAGADLSLLRMKNYMEGTYSDVGLQVIYDAGVLNIGYNSLKNIAINRPEDLGMEWTFAQLKYDAYENLLKNGYQYGLRKDLEEESLELIYTLDYTNELYHDEYIEDYIQSQLVSMHSMTLNDGRPGSLNVRIMSNANPNAFMLSNGTLIITTGLMSIVENEAELMGVLAHEVAHFVLDHQVINYNKQIEREERAKFWAGVATAVVAAGEVYLNSQTDVYTGGSLTYSAAVISSTIAASVTQRLGLKYSQEQELAADFTSQRILMQLGYDSTALSSVFEKLTKYHVQNENYYALSANGSHPSLPSRIDAMGKPSGVEEFSTDFHRKFSRINTFNAIQEYNLLHLESAEQLVDRNLDANVGTEDDYILKAVLCRKLGTPEKIDEALEYLEIAKNLDVNPRFTVYKQEAITLLRVDRNQEAIDALNIYMENLLAVDHEGDKEVNRYINNELEWTRLMIYKVQAILGEVAAGPIPLTRTLS